MTFSLSETKAPTTRPLKLDPVADKPHSSQFVSTQANRLHLSLGEQSPGIKEVTTAVSTGFDQNYRQMLADREMLRTRQAQASLLQEIVQTDPSGVTPEMMQVVEGLSLQDIQSPDLADIVERNYAKLFTNVTASALSNDILDEALDADPEGAADVLDRMERLTYKRTYAQNKLDEISQHIAGQSLAGKAWDFTERLVPFLEWYQKQNQIETLDSPFLPGNNLEAQFAYLWGLGDSAEFKRVFDQAYDDLFARNPQVAQSWLEGFFSYGSSDAFIDNLFGVADMAGVAPTKTLGKALRGALKAATTNPAKVPEIAGQLGKNIDAGMGKIVEEAREGAILGDIKNAKALEDTIPSHAAPDKMLSGSSNIPQSAHNRLKESLLRRNELMVDFLKVNQVDRLTPDEVLAGFRTQLADDYMFRHPSVQKNVIDLRVDTVGDVANVYRAQIVIGHRDGSLFESMAQAENYAKRYLGDLAADLSIAPAEGKKVVSVPAGITPVVPPQPVQNARVRAPAAVSGPAPVDYRQGPLTTIDQIGEGYQIVIRRDLDETKIRKLKLETGQKTTDSWISTFTPTRLLAGPNQNLSAQQTTARSVAVTSGERLGQIMSEMSEPFRRLSKKENEEMSDIMSFNRDQQEYYETLGDFEDAFAKRHGHLPTEDQMDAYLAYVQINDLDLMVRDLDWYKQKSMQGRESITISLADGDQTFEGKILDRLPFGSPDRFSVTIVTDGQASKPKPSRMITEKDKLEYDKLMSEGYRVIQVANQQFKVGDRMAGYVLAKSPKRSRVGLQNVDRKPGGHKVHEYGYYVKLANLNGDEDGVLYLGDKTFFSARTREEADQLADVLNTAVQKMGRGDADAMKYIRDNLPIPARQFMKMWKDGDLSARSVFGGTAKGQRLLEAGRLQDIDGLIDMSKNSHNLDSQITGRYAGERTETNIDIVRSEGKVLFEIETAPYLSPMDTLQAATNDIISKRAFDDYRMMTRTNFIREFGDILEGTREEQLASGYAVLTTPRFKQGSDIARQNQALNVSRAFNDLQSSATRPGRELDYFKEKVVSKILPLAKGRGQRSLELSLNQNAPNPGAWMRKMAFDFKMGWFNPNQYFVQLNNFLNINALEGMNGARASLSYLPMRWAVATNDPDRIKALGRTLENVGIMKTDEFVEGVEMYKRSGFNSVGNDAAYLDDMTSVELRKTAASQGFDNLRSAGRKPFEEGERAVRMSSFMAAFLSAKRAKKVLDRRDEAAILRRAKLLTGNMTRESNATWQKGYGGVVTQFMGYQMRLMEQYVGKQLTGPEKLKLFAAYSAVYGVPVGLGSAVGVIPVREMVTEYLLGQGVDINDPLIEPFIDGFASSFYEAVMGQEKNFADRYGPGGLPTFRDMWRQDKDWADIVLGASGGIALDTVASTWPIVNAMRSEFMDYKGGYYNLQPTDFLEPLRNITTVDSAVKLYNVSNFGIWMTKNGGNMTEMDLPDAVMAVLTGLQPAEIGDSFAAGRATKATEEYIKGVQKELIKEYREVMKMDMGATRDSRIKAIKARMILEGFSIRQMNQTWKYAADEEMMTDSFFEKYDEKVLRRKQLMENQK